MTMVKKLPAGACSGRQLHLLRKQASAFQSASKLAHSKNQPIVASHFFMELQLQDTRG